MFLFWNWGKEKCQDQKEVKTKNRHKAERQFLQILRSAVIQRKLNSWSKKQKPLERRFPAMCWILYSTDIIIVLLLRLAVYYCFAMYTAFFIMRIPEVRTISEKYKKIGMELIEKHPALEVLNRFIKAKAIKLIFLESTKEKKSTLGTVHADCEKIADSKRWAIDADFVITVYEPNV